MRLAITSWPMWKSRSFMVCPSRDGLISIRCAAGERVVLSLFRRIMLAVGRHEQIFPQHAQHFPKSHLKVLSYPFFERAVQRQAALAVLPPPTPRPLARRALAGADSQHSVNASTPTMLCHARG